MCKTIKMKSILTKPYQFTSFPWSSSALTITLENIGFPWKFDEARIISVLSKDAEENNSIWLSSSRDAVDSASKKSSRPVSRFWKPSTYNGSKLFIFFWRKSFRFSDNLKVHKSFPNPLVRRYLLWTSFLVSFFHLT